MDSLIASEIEQIELGNNIHDADYDDIRSVIDVDYEEEEVETDVSCERLLNSQKTEIKKGWASIL